MDAADGFPGEPCYPEYPQLCKESRMEVFGRFTRDLGDAAVGRRGFVKTLPHAAAVAVAVTGIALFSVALVWQQTFAAVIAALLVLLCWHTGVLLNERFYLQLGATVAPHGAGLSALGKDFDLAGCAADLGVPVKTLFTAENGTVLNRLMVMALAKEQIRCLGAIRLYRDAFGPLQEADVRAQSASAPSPVARAPHGGRPLPPQLNLAPLGLHSHVGAGAGGSAGGVGLVTATPRSPRGPPSPEQQHSQRLRRTLGGAGAGPAAAAAMANPLPSPTLTLSASTVSDAVAGGSAPPPLPAHAMAADAIPPLRQYSAAVDSIGPLPRAGAASSASAGSIAEVPSIAEAAADKKPADDGPMSFGLFGSRF